MAASGSVRAHKPPAWRGLNRADLFKVIANPLKLRKPAEPTPVAVFNSCASSDPINFVLEGHILPRLMVAQLVDGSLRPLEERLEIDSHDTHGFVPSPLRLEAPGLMAEVDRFLASGVSVEDVFLDLLAPAARHLGDLWTRDECDFVDVTMGVWRLQEVMREISLRAPSSAVRPVAPVAGNDDGNDDGNDTCGDVVGGCRRAALFCPVPGDVHSFGAQMLDEVFARAGWQSEVLLRPERRVLIDHVARNSLDLLGLTVSRSGGVAAVASLIKAIRAVSANPQLVVLVGGVAINQNPALVAEIGADGTGMDAVAALHTADLLVPRAPVGAHALI